MPTTVPFQSFVQKDGMSKSQNHTSEPRKKIAHRHLYLRQHQIAIDFYIDIGNGKKSFPCCPCILFPWLAFQTLSMFLRLANNESRIDDRRWRTCFSCLLLC